VEEIDQDNASALSRCLGGRNACPPEDCGGVFGYLNLLESLTDPNHPNHNEAREWVDVDFDPKRFDVATVNNLLMTLS
jgi:Plasmid pRiA4b ORF-3-like protein